MQQITFQTNIFTPSKKDFFAATFFSLIGDRVLVFGFVFMHFGLFMFEKSECHTLDRRLFSLAELGPFDALALASE